MQPLPGSPYEYAAWKKVRVNIDYHVAIDKHYYSVPYQLVKEELDSGSARDARKASTALTRDECLVDEQGQSRIDELTSSSQNLATIYEFRQRLQGIWAKRGGNAEELLAALKQWCLDAEATGIQVLKEFVAELRTYAMPKAATA
jgi:hypothetical protein